MALLGIGGSYVYLHQEDVEQGNAQLASLASSEASSASSAASSSLSAASSSHSKQVPLLAADNKSADSKSRQKAASSAASLLSSDYASVPVQSAAPMNDEGETMVAVASDEARWLLRNTNQQNQRRVRLNQTHPLLIISPGIAKWREYR